MKVVYPGSFHPPTLGHIDLIRRAAALFDEVVVAVMVNSGKTYLLSARERVEMLRACTAGLANVRVLADDGLAADLCRREGASALLHGLRDGQDYAYEAAIAQANRALGAPETIWLPADPALAHVSSTVAMDVARHGGPLERFVPAAIVGRVQSALAERDPQ